MPGVVVISTDAGRALRKARASLRVIDVLDCSGDFRSGDSVYVTTHAKDGRQYVIATAIAQLDAATLQVLKGHDDVAESLSTDPMVVICGQDIKFLWRTGV